ncbi:MAG: Ig-like domain-containing protein [Phycisphaerae bacterium]|nr:Ig-like domain-containing protein [Gemmatimonadaceae bacterium]
MRLTASAISRASLLFGLVLTASCGGGGGDGPTPPPPVEAVASVELSSATINMAPNTTSQLVATARSSAGAALSGRSFSWASVQPSVASVSASGQVTAVSEGTTTITVTSEGRSAAAAVVVRTPVAAVVVTPLTAQLTVGGTPSQLTAVARDANGATLAGRAIAWSSSAVGVATVSQTGLVTAVAAGTTTITATSDGRSGTAAITTVADPCNVVRTLAVGQTFTGSLTNADCKFTSDNTAFQLFAFTVATTTALEIEMSSGAVDPYLLVVDADDNVVAEDDDSGPGSGARVLRLFAPGTYFIVANTYDDNQFGAYTLTNRLAPAACSSSRPTALPFTLNTALTPAGSCRLNDDSFLDRYDLNLTAKTNVRLDMTSTVIDPYLYIVDVNGKPVAQDDDGGPGLNSRVDIVLQPGRYTVLASAQPTESGPYRLDITPALDPCGVNRTITIGQTQNATISTTDCAVGANGPMRLTQRFALNVTTQGPLQVDMASTQLDPYLIIQSATTGAVLAEHDDINPGVNRNARIAAIFPVGQYIINTTTFDDSLASTMTGVYALSVTAINPTTNVTISLPATLSLTAGQQQQLTPTIAGTTNTAVTWTTSAAGVATVDANGLVRALTAGTANIVATSAADPTKSATVAVTVTQTQGGAPNLDIAAMYLIQSVQLVDGSVKLVANREAVARVYLRGSRTGIGSATVRLRAFQGATLLQTFTANVNPTLTVDEGCCSANISIPASVVRAGVSIIADADPANAIAESNETDNSFPLSGTPLALNVSTVPDFNITLVPVRQNRSNLLGVANNTILSMLKSIWPLATVNVRTRATPLAIDYTLVSGSFDEWGFLVRDMELARRADPQAQYYYGLARVTYTSGVLGLAGGIPALSAVGLDEGSSFGAAEARLTLAHEMGHTIGLRHAPCGGAAGPDPAFPFADGRAGAFGLDIASGNILKVPSGHDVMSYCDNQWVSVYNYRNVFDQRARNPNGVPAQLAADGAPTAVLMVTGGVDAQEARIDGSFEMTARPNKYDPAGRFVLEGFGANGKVLFTHRFTPFEVSDGKPGAEGFVVGVPVSETMKAEIVRIAVREVNGSRKGARVKSTAAQAANTSVIAATRNTAGKFSLKWSTTSAPMVMVRNPAKGEVIGIGRGGDLDLAQFETLPNVDLLVTDGVSSVKRSVNTRTGVIRQ